MTAESAQSFDALERQAENIMAVFRAGGYERVAPAILQPAGAFLDRVGEAIRSRTYVFNDPEGAELCLRPDLTVPVGRIYLDRHPKSGVAARYSYNGPAFRYQPGEPHPLRPREFRQAGIENFGATNAEAADVEILALTANALRSAGLVDAPLKIGDIGVFEALLEAMPMPERWRRRIMAAFWRADALPDVLKRLSTRAEPKPLDPLQVIMDDIDPADMQAAAALVAALLEQNDIAIVGARTVGEIAERLAARKADMDEPPLSDAAVKAITDYLAITDAADGVTRQIQQLAASAGVNLDAALQRFEERLTAMADSGFNPANVIFSAETGRRFEYYTGFTFEFSSGDGDIPAPVASGGRYDRLLGALGAIRDTPAVGAAIYTERLLGAVERGAP